MIGVSKENRPILCEWRGRSNAPLKVVILAGQHGDERPARRVLQSLLAEPPDEAAARFSALQLAVVPEANPDGCALRSRCNADGIDLNRDHQLLRSNETAALHHFVRQWRPHIILDLQSYPSQRRHLLERNVVLDTMSSSTCPATPPSWHGPAASMAPRCCGVCWIRSRPAVFAPDATPLSALPVAPAIARRTW